jgi:type I restriction enzyme S subunit
MPDRTPVKALADLATLRTEKIVGAKDASKPYVGLEHMASGDPFLLGTARADSSISTNSVFYWGDVLFGKLRPNLRKTFAAPFDGYCSTDILVLQPNAGFDPGFVSRVFQREEVFEEAVRTAEGTKMPRTSWARLKQYEVFVPEADNERTAIAQVLDVADEAIAKTKALIAKLHAIRQGLLHDLLTRGLDDNGELRDPEKHPEQFEVTPLGAFPVEWGTPTVNELAVHVGSGITPTGGSDVYQHRGVLFIRSQNVTFDGLLLEDVAYIDQRTHQMMARSEVFSHDVLLNITGASIGRCCPMPAGLGPANVNQHVCAIRTAKPRRTDAIVLSAILASFIGQRQIDRLNAGSNRQGLNYRQLRSFLIPWPKRDSERDVMATRIEAADSRVRAEEAYLSKLKAIKTGLMHDLLSGRVCVQAGKVPVTAAG